MNILNLFGLRKRTVLDDLKLVPRHFYNPEDGSIEVVHQEDNTDPVLTIQGVKWLPVPQKYIDEGVKVVPLNEIQGPDEEDMEASETLEFPDSGLYIHVESGVLFFCFDWLDDGSDVGSSIAQAVVLQLPKDYKGDFKLTHSYEIPEDMLEQAPQTFQITLHQKNFID